MQEIQWYIVQDNRHSRNATGIQELSLSHKSQACTYMGKYKKEDYKRWQRKITFLVKGLDNDPYKTAVYRIIQSNNTVKRKIN